MLAILVIRPIQPHPFDSNYQDKDVSSQSELKELTRLRLEKEVLMEMLKEHITTNSR